MWTQAAPSCGFDNPKADSASAKLVREVLELEQLPGNESSDRRTLLNPGSRPVTDPDAVWWQAGYAKSGNGWKAYEETIADGNDAAKLEQYQEQRVTSAKLPHPEWKLANWCRKNGLLDQERVHLMRAMASGDPAVDRSAACERLGYQRVGETWISPQEIREARQLAAEVEQSHQRWDAKLEAVLNGLQGSHKQRMQAEASLKSITDPLAVPAIVSSFCMKSEPLAKIGVRTLGQIPQYQASRALAGQAVFSPWRTIRSEAIEFLKERKLEDFAPDLLMILAKPIQIRHQIDRGTVRVSQPEVGNIVNIQFANCDFALIEESHDTTRVAVRRLFPQSLQFSDDDPKLGSTSTRYEQFPVPWRLGRSISNRLELELFDQAEAIDYSAGVVNEFRVSANERVGRVLSECADEPFTSDPEKWWDWWANHSGLSRPAQKNVVIVDERKPEPSYSIREISSGTTSCLVAGTPIWTEKGLVDIEKIQPGDRVLSKEIDTGELTFKPVLRVTERPPVPVAKIHLANESIEASSGHHFWVSGAGWTKTRKLSSGQPIHTVTGMQRIERIVDKSRTASVYNLVVLDAHTYFVGKSMILSHDVLLPSPTNVKVPGLAIQ